METTPAWKSISMAMMLTWRTVVGFFAMTPALRPVSMEMTPA